MSILLTLCARGGSKGIPGKNIKLINGKPLISLSIEVAKSFSKIYDVDIALSTDNEDIKNIASLYDLKTSYIRPDFLASDSAGKLDTIRHLLNFEETFRNKKYDFVLDLDITSPLRTVSDLNNAFQILKSDHKSKNIFSVNPANRNPYFNMVEQQANGYFGLVKIGNYLTRQSAPSVYELNASFYFFKRSFFEEKLNPINEFSQIYIMPHICFDLDHPIDFEFMNYLLANNKLDFFK
jgi:CMP-N,N'-diacetyllegionaminic acid synthase